jgi:colicin import membrane protein
MSRITNCTRWARANFTKGKTMTTELATLENTEIQLAFTSPGGIDILIDRLRNEAAHEVPDLTTKKGRDRIASLAYKVSKTKTLVDDYGKELVAEEKKRLALIDADRKKWRDTCDELRDQIRQPLTDWENAEKARVQRHTDAVAAISAMTQVSGMTAADIAARLSDAEAIAINDGCEEFAAQYAKAKDAAVTSLRASLASRRQYEAEQAELARLREETARREQEERDRRIAEEAAARAKAEAEAKAKAEREAAERAAREAHEQAERARIAAEQAEARAKAEAEAAKLREQEAERRRIEQEERAAREAKEAAERAERDRMAAIEAERRRAAEQAERERIAAEQDAARRAADVEHRRSINKDALADLMACGLSDDDAKKVIQAIAAGKVRHASIRY